MKLKLFICLLLILLISSFAKMPTAYSCLCPPCPPCYRVTGSPPNCGCAWNCSSGQICCNGSCITCSGTCCNGSCCNPMNCEYCDSGSCIPGYCTLTTYQIEQYSCTCQGSACQGSGAIYYFYMCYDDYCPIGSCYCYESKSPQIIEQKPWCQDIGYWPPGPSCNENEDCAILGWENYYGNEDDTCACVPET